MFRELYRWWLDQLAGLLPQALRRPGAVLPDATIVGLEPGAYTLSLRRNGGVNSLARFERNSQGIRALQQRLAGLGANAPGLALGLPRERVLAKRVTLPLAARADLAQALAFEIARETPFEEGEVLWDYTLVRVDRALGRLEAELVLVPRAPLADDIAAIAAAHLAADAVEVEGLARPYRMALGGSARREGRAPQRAMPALAALTVLLALAAVLTPFVKQQWALGRLGSEIAALDSDVHAAAAMRSELEKLSKAADFLGTERARIGSPLATLAALTRVVPDDSYLTVLTLRDGQLTIAGRSPSSAGLIVKLAATKTFKDPAFVEPVVRAKGDDLEFFTIRTAVAAGGGS